MNIRTRSIHSAGVTLWPMSGGCRLGIHFQLPNVCFCSLCLCCIAFRLYHTANSSPPHNSSSLSLFNLHIVVYRCPPFMRHAIFRADPTSECFQSHSIALRGMPQQYGGGILGRIDSCWWGSPFNSGYCCCCSHIKSRNQARSHRTDFSNSGLEGYPREEQTNQKRYTYTSISWQKQVIHPPVLMKTKSGVWVAGVK